MEVVPPSLIKGPSIGYSVRLSCAHNEWCAVDPVDGLVSAFRHKYATDRAVIIGSRRAEFLERP
jgi:hypothetical protein